MTALAQRTVSCGTNADIARRRGVVKAGELRLAAQAASVLDAARDERRRLLAAAEREAEGIVDEGRAEAQRLIDTARESMQAERVRTVSKAENDIWYRAIGHKRALDEHYQDFSKAVEDRVLDTVRKALAALTAEMPSEARLRACARLILGEAGRPAEAKLVVSEQDRAGAEAVAAELPWPIEFDPAAAPGSCVLLSARGEWRTSFDGNLERLLSVFERKDAAAGAAEQGEDHDRT